MTDLCGIPTNWFKNQLSPPIRLSSLGYVEISVLRVKEQYWLLFHSILWNREKKEFS
jgi:hypothetical protein